MLGVLTSKLKERSESWESNRTENPTILRDRESLGKRQKTKDRPTPGFQQQRNLGPDPMCSLYIPPKGRIWTGRTQLEDMLFIRLVLWEQSDIALPDPVTLLVTEDPLDNGLVQAR